MDWGWYRQCLDADFHTLRRVAVDADPSAPVPGCPGWTLDDLVRHVARVYLHKVENIRQHRDPEPWPPPGVETEPLLGLLDRAHAALIAEFDQRPPEEQVYGWYGPDQTVGFWIRRMAQETVIHRVDAEQAAGQAVAPVPDDLAEDGIDEILVAFVAFGIQGWPDMFADLLPPDHPLVVMIRTPGRAWTARLAVTGPTVADGVAAGPADVTVEGPPDQVLLWLWNRGGEAMVTGTAADQERLHSVLVRSTQ